MNNTKRKFNKKETAIMLAVSFIAIVLMTIDANAADGGTSGYSQLETAGTSMKAMFKGTGMTLVNTFGAAAFLWSAVVQKSPAAMITIIIGLAGGNILSGAY